MFPGEILFDSAPAADPGFPFKYWFKRIKNPVEDVGDSIEFTEGFVDVGNSESPPARPDRRGRAPDNNLLLLF